MLIFFIKRMLIIIFVVLFLGDRLCGMWENLETEHQERAMRIHLMVGSGNPDDSQKYYIFDPETGHVINEYGLHSGSWAENWPENCFICNRRIKRELEIEIERKIEYYRLNLFINKG